MNCACGEPVTEHDPYYATPCGTHCEECMEKHTQDCAVCRAEFD